MMRILIASLAFASAYDIVCYPNVCDNVICTPVEKKSCPGGFILSKGSFCGCCDVCFVKKSKLCSTSICYCVDPNGNMMKSYRADISQAADMNCQCALDQFIYRESKVNGKLFLCDSNGNYHRYQCLGSECFCSDSYGQRKPGTISVPISHIILLKC